jgi:DNA polymerase I-like protein with 3'-5' exonuclease and polymerase domains
MRVENIILNCEQNGVRIDVARMAIHSDTLRKRMDLLRSAAISCAGCEFDVDSLKSSTDILRKLGIWEKTAQSVGDVQLEQLASSHDLPFLIAKYRRTHKRYKEADALCVAAKDGHVFPALSQIKGEHSCIWSNSPALEEAIATQAIQDKQLLGILACSETALLNLRDISGDAVLRDDLNDYKPGSNFIPCGDLCIHGVTHCEILLYVATGLSDATICRKLLITKTQAVQIRTAITSRYEHLFDWLDQFTRYSIEHGYAEYAGRRKYLDGLRSSDIDKRTKAVRSVVRWLIRY